jgi:hypothetical protein
MNKEKEVKVIGDFTWQQTRDMMIVKLMEINNEEEFGKFFRKMAGSVGTLEDIQKERKRLGIKPLTKEELEELEK